MTGAKGKKRVKVPDNLNLLKYLARLSTGLFIAVVLDRSQVSNVYQYGVHHACKPSLKQLHA